MVHIGLLPQKDLDRFKAKRMKALQEKDAINLNQAQYTESLTLFALINFDSLPKVYLDRHSIQNLLDMAYTYWEFFR